MHAAGRLATASLRSRTVLGVAVFVLLSTAVLGGVAAGSTLAQMTAAGTTGSAFTAGSIFPAVRSSAAWNVRDSSSGTEVDKSDPFSYAGDSLVTATGAFPVAFSATRYVQWDYNDSLPAGLPVSSTSFNLRMIPNAAAQIACWYIEVRRISTGALLASHGSALLSYACATGATYSTVTVSLPEVTTTDIANDLRIKLFVNETGAAAVKIDLATVSGSTAYGSFNLYEKTWTNAATGTATVTPWALATVDAVVFSNATNWTTTFAATRYLRYTFDPAVPAGSVLTSATLSHTYQSTTAATSCYYFEVYSGATLIGTHGSAATPVSCATNAAWISDTVTLAEVNSVAIANGVQIRMYVKNSGSSKTRHDRVLLNLTYSRP
jgi:hypothetical protein